LHTRASSAGFRKRAPRMRKSPTRERTSLSNGKMPAAPTRGSPHPASARTPAQDPGASSASPAAAPGAPVSRPADNYEMSAQPTASARRSWTTCHSYGLDRRLADEFSLHEAELLAGQQPFSSMSASLDSSSAGDGGTTRAPITSSSFRLLAIVPWSVKVRSPAVRSLHPDDLRI
jgi:hypothetical protein